MTIIWKHQSIIGLTVEKETVFNHPTAEGLRLRVLPSGKKTWVWTRMRDGKRPKKTLGRFPAFGLDDAQVWAGEINAAFDMGEEPMTATEKEALIAPKPEVHRVTFAEAFEDFIADRRRAGIKSVEAICQSVEKDILPIIGEIPLADITPKHVREIIQRPIDRVRSGEKSGRTGGAMGSNAALRQLKTILTFAVQNRLDGIEWNAALGTKPIAAKNITGKRIVPNLSMEDLAAIILATRELDRRKGSHTSEIFQLIIFFGNRKSEVYYARTREWDSAAKVWTIPPERHKMGIRHSLPAAPLAAAILDRLADRGETFLIHSQRGIRTGRDTYVTEDLSKIASKILGREIPRWTPHDLRHAFRRNWRLQKIADVAIAEAIIHPKMKRDMSEYYDDFSLAEQREALAKWEARVMEYVSELQSGRLKEVA